MEQFDQSLETFMDNVGWLAPLLFIFLHLLRPLLFLPVIAVCIAGGYLFGFFEGALLSFIGLTLMSWISYILVNKFPKFQEKMTRLKDKIFSDRTLSVAQVMILRIMPFVHFHLLSLYLMEITKSLKEYMVISALGLIAPAILYTAFGQSISEFPWYITLSMFLLLAAVFSFIEKWHNSRPQSD